MIKWLFSTLGFIFLAIAISSLTMGVFLTSAVDNFDILEKTFSESADELVNTSLVSFYEEMTQEQVQNIQEIEALTPVQRQLILPAQCKDESGFCNPRFISGEINFDQSIRESASLQIEEQQEVALGGLRDKIQGYLKYPLIMISIIGSLLSLIFYIVGSKVQGIQSFFGNVSWLSLLSAVTFKLMPLAIDKIISAAGSGLGEGVDLLRESALAWLVPSMNAGFWLSVWLTIIGFVVWFAIKFFRQHSVSME